MAGTLKEQLREEITDALRAGDKVRLGALRLLSAAVTNQEKELRRELSDDELRAVAGKEMKKRAESIEAFEAAGRQELADKERAERDAPTRRSSSARSRWTRSSTRPSTRPAPPGRRTSAP